MKIDSTTSNTISTALPSGMLLLPDPLDPDAPGDAVVTTSLRGLVRLALVASEAGARFQREGEAIDPMAWLLAPRRMFDGASAVEACIGRTACIRALLLNGLGLNLDAEPAELDYLLDDTVDEPDASDAPDVAEACGGAEIHVLRDGDRRNAPALYTSTAVDEDEHGLVHVFEAAVAGSREEARAMFVRRHGSELAAGAETSAGFRADLPLVEALVSPAMADMLSQVAGDPTSPLARGLQVTVEQRFAS